MLDIHVRNTTEGNASTGTGLGLSNVEARIRHLYSGRASFRLIFAEDRTATATLSLPALDRCPTGFETVFESRT